MRERRPWDGRWLVVSVPIPETQRQLRHRLRTRLSWLGLGSPTSGLWIATDATKADDVQAVVRDLGLADLAFAWTGSASGLGEEGRLLAEAWDLEEVEDRYVAFLSDFEIRIAPTDLEAFVAQVQMIEEWRRFPFLDPDLPRRAARPRLARAPRRQHVPPAARPLAPPRPGRLAVVRRGRRPAPRWLRKDEVLSRNLRGS